MSTSVTSVRKRNKKEKETVVRAADITWYNTEGVVCWLRQRFKVPVQFGGGGGRWMGVLKVGGTRLTVGCRKAGV